MSHEHGTGRSPNRSDVALPFFKVGRVALEVAERAGNRPQTRVVMIALEVDKRHGSGDTSDETETYNLGTV